jgi:hypothetical protein
MSATAVHADPMDLVRDVGAALYGPRWQRELARALGVSERAVRRWVGNEAAPPADIEPRLRVLIDARIVELHTLRLRLMP